MSSISWMVIPIVTGFAAAAALAFAWRGRRVDAHPICRKCGFDLFRRPPGAVICPECGAEIGISLRDSGAVRYGHRQKRQGLALIAAPILLICVSWIGLLAWSHFGGVDFNRFKPVWWLAAQARGKDMPSRDAALAELCSRVTVGQLRGAPLQALVERALDEQGDASKKWTPGWGNLVEAAHGAGALAADRWQRYARQAVSFEFAVRPKVRRGDPLPLMVSTLPARVARGSCLYCVSSMRRRPEILEAPELTPSAERWTPFFSDRLDAGGAGPSLSVSMGWSIPEWTAQMPVGALTARLPLELTIYESPSRSLPVVQFRCDPQSKWELLPADVQSVRTLTDPNLRSEVSERIRFQISRNQGPRGPVSIRIHDNGVSVGLAFDILIRDADSAAEGREHRVGEGTFAPRSRNSSVGCEYEPEVLNGARADVILRPSVAVAARTVYLTEIWGEEVVIKNVPVDGP